MEDKQGSIKVQEGRVEPSSNQVLLEQSRNREVLDEFLTECYYYVRSVKSSDKKPTCFISYAWNNSQYEKWVEQLAEDLEKAGFNILLDRWFVRKGHDTMDFVEKILDEETDYILVIGTKLYLEKYKQQASQEMERERVVKIEVRLLNHLIGFNHIRSEKVIPILLEGKPEESLPLLMQSKNIVDFTQQHYALLLFELIRDLHCIDQRDKEFKKLQERLQESLVHQKSFVN